MKSCLDLVVFQLFFSFPEDLYPPFNFTHLALKMLELQSGTYALCRYYLHLQL